MKARLVTSQFIRNYYSGNNEEALRVSDPDITYGRISANDIALKSYYSMLNKTVDDANCHEMMAGIGNFNLFMARKKMIELELASICTQMQKRDIYYPCIETPISDFAVGMMSDAALLSDQFKESENKKGYTKVIYL